MTARQIHVQLPKPEFYYTLDQVGTILAVSEPTLKTMLHYAGRSVGARPKDKILAINIMPDGEEPQWRISEVHLKRFLKARGIRYSDRGIV